MCSLCKSHLSVSFSPKVLFEIKAAAEGSFLPLTGTQDVQMQRREVVILTLYSQLVFCETIPGPGAMTFPTRDSASIGLLPAGTSCQAGQKDQYRPHCGKGTSSILSVPVPQQGPASDPFPRGLLFRSCQLPGNRTGPHTTVERSMSCVEVMAGQADPGGLSSVSLFKSRVP